MPVVVCQVNFINTPSSFYYKGISSNFWVAIFLLLIALFAKGFHAYGTATNPLDIAPKHSGSISGITYCAAASSGLKLINNAQSSLPSHNLIIL